MNDLQITYFLKVAQTNSFTKAAELLYVTQPAVSKQISALEKELDVSLFDRTAKMIQLTDAGRLYYEFFSNYMKQRTQLKQQVSQMNKHRQGYIRIGCMEGWNLTGFFPEILEKFKSDYPNIQISLECLSIHGLIDAINNNEIDVALTIDVTLDSVEHLYRQKLTSIPRILLYSKSHPLSKKKVLTPSDFCNETFFVLGANELSTAAGFVKDYMKPYGFEPKIQLVRNIESMINCVRNGLGVAISDSWSNAKAMNDFNHIPIGSDHNIIIAWPECNDQKSFHILANELMFILSK